MGNGNSDNKKCVEYYNFKGNNNVVIKSGSEWTTGLYDYQPSQDPAAQIPALIMQVKYDNNEKTVPVIRWISQARFRSIL